jgi:hypothetical protein
VKEIQQLLHHRDKQRQLAYGLLSHIVGRVGDDIFRGALQCDVDNPEEIAHAGIFSIGCSNAHRRWAEPAPGNRATGGKSRNTSKAELGLKVVDAMP